MWGFLPKEMCAEVFSRDRIPCIVSGLGFWEPQGSWWLQPSSIRETQQTEIWDPWDPPRIPREAPWKRLNPDSYLREFTTPVYPDQARGGGSEM